MNDSRDASNAPAMMYRGSLDRMAAAQYLSISIRLLDRLVSDGEIPVVKIGRKPLFRTVDLDRFLERKLHSVEESR